MSKTKSMKNSLLSPKSNLYRDEVPQIKRKDRYKKFRHTMGIIGNYYKPKKYLQTIKARGISITFFI